jgi:hypothetical protein
VTGRLDHACQAGRHPNAERGFDLYETPAIAVEALLAVEKLPHRIWEPAAGRGAIVKVLQAAGHSVIASDIIDYGFPLDFVADFLTTIKRPAGCDAIVTNAPFQCLDRFARHALDLAPRVCLLCRLAWYQAQGRVDILERRGLARVHVFRGRLPMMHRDGWTGRRSSSAMAFAWYCWERDYRGAGVLFDRIGPGRARGAS